MRRRIVICWFLSLVLVPTSALIGGYAWLQTADGRRWLADRIEMAVTTPYRQLSVGALEGAIPFSPVMTDVVLSDSQGQWLTVDRAAVRLDPVALFDSEFRFEGIDLGRVGMMRRPISQEPGAEQLSTEAFTWPKLPVTVRLERIDVTEVALDASVLGEPARFRVAGAARIGNPANALELDLAIVRTDHTPGELGAQVRFVPANERLTTTLRLDEPEGGILARLAGLTGLPALTADLSGDGPLDDWHAEFILDGGDDLNLNAKAIILAEAAGYRATLEATGRLAAFVDDALTPLLDSTTSLGGSVLVGTDGNVRINRFELAGAFGEASLTGGIDLAGESADIAMTLNPGAPDRFAQLTKGADWRELRLSAALKGSVLEPALTLSIVGNGVAYDDVTLESLVATAEVAATAPITDAETRIEVAANLLAEGLDPGAGLPSGLLEPQMRIDAQGSIDRAGRVVVDSLTIDAPAARLSARGGGKGWGVESASVVGTLDVPELSRLDTPANRPLDGAGVVRFSADWDGTSAVVGASAEMERLSMDIGALDALLGSAPQVALDASVGADGTVDIESLELTGTGLSMWVSGEIGTDALGIDWRLSLADLAMLNPSLRGGLAAVEHVNGPRDDPAATARLTLTEALLAGNPVAEAQLDADFIGLLTQPAGHGALQAKFAGLSLQATAGLTIENDGAIRIDGLALDLASLTAEGEVTLSPDRTASGQVSASLGSLADLAPLIGETLYGSVEASMSLSQDGSRQLVDARISTSGAGLPGVAEVGHTSLELKLRDPLARPDVVARLQADAIRAGEVALDRAVVTAEGSPGDLDVALDLTAGMLAANASGQVALADGETRIEVADFSARFAGVVAALARPARITLASDHFLIDGLALQAEGGRLSVDGRHGDRSDLEMTLTDVPLDLVRLITPDVDLSGRLDGRARLTGTRAVPLLSGDFTATGVALPAVRKAGIAGLDVKSKLAWDAATLDLEAIVSGGFDGALTASASLPAPPDPATGLPNLHGRSALVGKISGNTRLGVLNDLLAARGDRVGGAVSIDLNLSGRLEDPRIAGMLALTDGSYRGPLTGISLDDISARLNSDGDRLTIAQLSASAPDGGTVRASGSIGLDAGFPADISLAFGDALIIDNDLITAEVAGTVAVTGELARTPTLAGQLRVVEAEIRLPERLPPSIQKLEVEEINVPPELAAQRPSPHPSADGTGAPLSIALDFALDAPGRVFVRGRGIDAEVAGEIRVRGNTSAPEMAGGFQLRRGHLDALGRRFSFDEGVVTLPEDGGVDADIRFVARAQARDVSAQITVTGRASAPNIQVESVPELPQDEVLARILFGKRSDSLSALESIQLARSAFELTGIGSGPDLLGGIGTRLRLDRAEMGQTDAGGPALNLRRRIAEGVGLGVQQGLQTGSGRATVELELMPNVSVETEVGVNNTGRVGIGMEWEY